LVGKSKQLAAILLINNAAANFSLPSPSLDKNLSYLSPLAKLQKSGQ